MEYYETFSTTADVGIRIAGRGYEGLLLSAIKGLNLLLFGHQPSPTSTPEAPDAPDAPDVYPFEFHGDSFENVLVNLLSEILFLLQNRMQLTVSLKINEVNETYLNAELLTTPAPEEPEVEIKSVTYHNLKIKRNNDTLATDIIFDI